VNEDDHKSAFWINDISFRDCFNEYQPRLIFLQACEGAYSASYETFRGVALQLVYSRIPAVVAMQYKVRNDEAKMFAKKFYQSLGEGKRIDEAVQDGRLVLGKYLNEQTFSSRAFGSPVVYLQSGEGIIIAEKKDLEVPSVVQPQVFTLTKVPCPYPDCPGMVISDSTFCLLCKRDLMICPKCKAIVAKDIGICHRCKYEVSRGKEIKQAMKHKGAES
jgi:hypothetical protein